MLYLCTLNSRSFLKFYLVIAAYNTTVPGKEHSPRPTMNTETTQVLLPTLRGHGQLGGVR